MSHRSNRSRISVFVLVLTLVAPWASAAQPQSRHTAHTRAVSSNSMSWSLWEMLRGLVTGSWAKNGCSADPFGRPVCQQDPDPNPQSQVDAGCQVDPNGGCLNGR